MGSDPLYVSNKRADGGAPYGRLLFHSDTMWSDDPIEVLSLYAIEVEQPAVFAPMPQRISVKAHPTFAPAASDA